MKQLHADAGSFFPFGTHYYCAPTPLPEDWEPDFEQLAKAGYTHVQFRTLWRWHERRRGEFRWDDTDRLFDLAGTHGLRVILKPMLENAPDYAFTELNGDRIGFHGVPITRFAMNSAYYAGGFMPCFDNPDVIAASKTFLRLLVRRYKNHPALWCYDAWNEPRSRPLAQCHCEHSAASYRAWLEQRFGSIDELNATFQKAWGSYEGVIPPASPNDVVEMFLWRQWAGWAVAEQVRFVADTIRAEHPEGFVFLHAGACDVLRDPVCDSCDDIQNARISDRYGLSLNIPQWPKTPADHNEAEFISSWMRRVDPRYWCHEFYPKGAPWCRETEPLTLGRHLWMAIAGGCGALTFWEYRSVRQGIRSNGFGMREIDGSPNERSQVCDAIAGVLKQHGARLAQTRRVPARVRLLFSKPNDIAMRVLAMQSWMGDLQRQMPDVDYPYKQALRGAHLLYQGNGEDVDFVLPGDELGGSGLVHVTATELINAATADRLRAFVRAGGTLVAEFPFACRDDRTWIWPRRPGHGLEDLLGCTEGRREVTRDDPPDTATFAAGFQLAARGWRITLNPTRGEPIARWDTGAVAAVRHAFGKGQVFALGINVSLAFANRWQDPAFGVAGWLLRQAGLTPPPWAQDREVWVRRRRGNGFEVWFVFNVAEEAKTVALPAEPVAVWHGLQAERGGKQDFLLAPGAALVAEMPARGE